MSILSYRNQPAPQAPVGHFTDAGGSLGRSPDNLLVLDDPGKYISRVHARVSCRAGTYFLEDVGSNPSVINDRPLGKGREIALNDGDRLVIGDYQLEARIAVAAAAPAPWLPPAPLNDTALPLFEPPPAPPPVQLPPLELVPAPVAPPPLAAAGIDSLAAARILDIEPGGGAGSAMDDPLGLNLFASTPPAPAALPGDLGLNLAPQYRAAESDHVSPELVPFRLPAAAAPSSGPTSGPVAPASAARPAAAFAIPDDYDPLADLLPRAAAPVPAPLTSPAPDLFAGLTPPAFAAAPAPSAAPVPTSPEAAPPPMAVAPPASPQAPSAPLAAFLNSAAASADDAHTLMAPAYRTAPAVPAVSAPPPAAAGAARSDSDSDILQALLRGLGLPDLQLNRSGVQVAETVGAMLREATAGAMDVLMARALTKKESRIDMTMISVSANNPLKFFPNPDSALTQMLTNAMAGYMPPVQAMRSAFDDVKAHELAVIAGMRAALASVLQRFDPARIESRLAVPSVMDKMLSSSRKAKLWDSLVELYGEIAREADDDVQRLFSEKFAQAYEEQVERLRRAGNKPGIN
ncbi:type VI secretion system-associated FHA domain protein TagH [Oxalobacteraceae bacterium A2-2]